MGTTVQDGARPDGFSPPAQETRTVRDRVLDWAEQWQRALPERDEGALRRLLTDDVSWRDVVSLTWDVRQSHGVDAVVAELVAAARDAQVAGVRIDDERPEPRVVDPEAGIIEAFLRFDTRLVEARLLAQLTPSPEGGLRAVVLSTTFESLRAAPPRDMTRRPEQLGFEPTEPGQAWGDHFAERVDFADRDPEVLVVGGGHCGIGAAAGLVRFGVDVLVVDPHQRIGDQWRERYDALALHSPSDITALPFFDQPAFLPEYLPKDRWADYLETYVRFHEVPCWTDTRVASATLDDAASRWDVELRHGDGRTRLVHPRHLVMATGFSGEPYVPALPGLAEFGGQVMHSTRYRSGKEHRNARAVVVGTGTSGHDIALDLARHGADVTMLQRGPTTIVSLGTARLGYGHTPGMPLDELDQRGAALLIKPVFLRTAQGYTALTQQLDEELLAALRQAGMLLDTGADGTGWLGKVFRTGSGYYFDVGASQAIIDGDIRVVQMSDVDSFVERGIRMRDGSERDVDVVVLATGFQNPAIEAERVLGAEVASRLGPIGGLGEDGEMRHFCRPTPQRNLWFSMGTIADARRAYFWLPGQIKARLAGLVPESVREDDGTVSGVA